MSQQNESWKHTALTHPFGSHPLVSAPANAVQRSCEQVPCGGVVDVDWQRPLTHVCAVVHVVPHFPQLFGSLIVSTHMLVQSVIPPEHWQVLLVQVDPLGQTLLQLPQFWSSCVVSTQRLPQTVKLQVLPS